MAFQKEITVKTNVDVSITVPDAYLKVGSVVVSKVMSIIRLDYYDKKDGNQVHGETFLFSPDISDGAKNPLAQAYEHLKTLPEFADAQDC